MTAIQYELTADDFVEFNHFHHKHSPELRRRLLLSRIVIPLFMILALLLTPLLMQRNDRGYREGLTRMRWFFAVPRSCSFTPQLRGSEDRHA
jgi:hypothetical protein